MESMKARSDLTETKQKIVVPKEIPLDSVYPPPPLVSTFPIPPQPPIPSKVEKVSSGSSKKKSPDPNNSFDSLIR